MVVVLVYLMSCGVIQEIDALLSGGLTQQDEDDVLKELDQIVKVSSL